MLLDLCDKSKSIKKNGRRGQTIPFLVQRYFSGKMVVPKALERNKEFMYETDKCLH